MPVQVLTVVGARPQIIKEAALARAIQARDDVEEVLVHTGQHYDHELSGVFFDELAIPAPDHNLGVGSAPHGAQTGRMLEKLEQVLDDEDPDAVVTYGDTNSTMAAALTAVKLHIPTAHVEAGLRSFDRRMPEEVNRVVTDQVASWLFCPSRTAVDNLADEGVRNGVHMVGDLMQDILRLEIPGIRKDASLGRILEDHGIDDAFVLATVHRQANTDDPANLQAVFDGLRQVASEIPVVAPLHPRTRNALDRSGVATGEIVVVDPVPYRQILHLMDRARVVCTDSGGMQKEAYWLETPCVTMRPHSEWTETLDAGWNRLVDADTEALVEAVHDPPRGDAHPPLYGDGHAAGKIVEILVEDIEAGDWSL